MSTSAVNPAPYSYSFRCLRTQQFSWTLTDTSGNPVSNCSVSSSLYSSRSLQNPVAMPGIIDPIFQNISMPETPTASGIYVGTVPETFNPTPNTTQFTSAQYVLFITASLSSTVLANWNIPAVVVPVGSPIDLVLLDDVKNWLDIASTNNDDDYMLQLLITSFSRYVLNRTGRDSFLSTTYTEIYDGNNAQRIFLRNSPITNVSSIVVGSYSIPQSTGLTVPGWFIEQSAKSIALRSYGYSYYGQPGVATSIFPQRFYEGIGNLQITYTAGWTTIPPDLYDAVMETVSVIYARKDWKDMLSRALSISGGSGTTTFRREFLTPGVEEIIQHHSRRSLNG